ncbi:helix-turn-helix domain-containing protein [Streptomyces sp. NPDC018031]|uniref:helix-turn-helix domain-containing protein n=1 Tax=Streptomyces sp. NPDC018031 TaxID=3365033 RepID=UPI00378A668C
MAENPLYARPVDGPEQVRDAPPVPAMTVNELVSYNLLRARRAQGWTQQQLGEALGRYTGRAWSNASVSAAERAWQGGRPRKFDAEEIALFSRIFDVPFSYFLMPPEEDHLIVFRSREGDPVLHSFPPVEYLKCVLAVDPPAKFLERAQGAVSQNVDLDFAPAAWQLGAGEPKPPRSEARDAILKEDNELRRAEAAKRFEDYARKAGLSEEMLEALTAARIDEVSFGVARRLDAMGYIRDPDYEEKLQKLNERLTRKLVEAEKLVERLTGRIETEE